MYVYNDALRWQMSYCAVCVCVCVCRTDTYCLLSNALCLATLLIYLSIIAAPQLGIRSRANIQYYCSKHFKVVI
jgi:hypothetical protein